MSWIRNPVVFVTLVLIAIVEIGGCQKGGKAIKAPDTVVFICPSCKNQFKAHFDPSAATTITPEKKCPKCGKTAFMASKCLNCGKYYLTSQAMGSTKYNPEGGAVALKCPHCGKDPTKAPASAPTKK